MLMDKTRFDNEVYATGRIAMAVNYYMDQHSYVEETLMASSHLTLVYKTGLWLTLFLKTTFFYCKIIS